MAVLVKSETYINRKFHQARWQPVEFDNLWHFKVKTYSDMVVC